MGTLNYFANIWSSHLLHYREVSCSRMSGPDQTQLIRKVKRSSRDFGYGQASIKHILPSFTAYNHIVHQRKWNG